MDPKTFAANMIGLAEYFEAQAVVAGFDLASVRRSQSVSFVSMIGSLRNINIAEATELTRTITSGIWGPDEVRSLSDAVAKRLTAGMTNSQGKKTQECAFVENYPTKLEWETIGDTRTPLNNKVKVIAIRCNKIGIVNPSEHLAARLTAILILHGLGTPSMDSTSQHEVLLDVKREIKALAKGTPFPFAHIFCYPDSPSDLPADVLKYAYNNGAEDPCAVSINDLDRVASAVPLRNTNKALRSGQGKGTLALPAAAPPNADAFAQFQEYQMRMYQQQMCGGGFSAGHGGVPIGPPQFEKKPPLALGDADAAPASAPASTWRAASFSVPAASGAAQSPSSGTQRDISVKPDDSAAAGQPLPNDASAVEQMEATTLAAIKAKKAATASATHHKKKPAAAPQAKAKAKAHAKAVTHRPPMPTKKAGKIAPISYNGGTIYVSVVKEAFRVLPTVGDRVDKAVLWSVHGGRANAWKRALEIIDAARASD